MGLNTDMISNISNVKDLLDSLEKNGFAISAPIDVDRIAEILGVSIEYYYNSDGDDVGSITRRGNEATIKINKSQNGYEPRKRFTLAHEIGHLCKHLFDTSNATFVDTQKTMSRTQSYWDIQESEANAFAAHLLMPKRLVHKEGKTIISEFKRQNQADKINADLFIEKMAKKFKVSNPAMKYRLKNLKILR